MLNKKDTNGYLVRDIIPKSKREKLRNQLMEDQFYDGLSIEIWKIISASVQKFTISDGSEAEIEHNINILKKALEKSDINFLEAGLKTGEHFWNVGLETLICYIYGISSPNIKDHFSSQIENLIDIGVDTIAFDPSVHHLGTIERIETNKADKIQPYSIIDKVYTDGTFIIRNHGGYYHLFDIEKLMGDNYYIWVELLNEDNNTKLVNAKATLRNFEGVYPTKNELIAFRQPMLTYAPINNEELEKFLRGKELYEEYISFVESQGFAREKEPQRPMPWQVTKRRVKEVLKK